MVGRIGTEEMSGVSVANQLVFVFNLCIVGTVSGAGIFGAYESNNGFTSAYDSGKNLFQVVKFLTGSNVQATNEDLFGCVGLRGERSNPNDQPYFILKNTAGGAVASSVPYVDKTTTNANYRSCAVMIEEVDYYNKLVFRSPATPPIEPQS